ncbi:hypothetical protein D9619_011840 [Psilocybe cf. subviscida]|uniref:PARP catalytic domain-containing protein n=1 Tax=Psilocybe cf. subviscida TaxID=2480587 RepID=A0A8H5EVW6_9AGAR|nr:hypothetical protein D9619_011840 [Psilocybe cf. subviscida]
MAQPPPPNNGENGRNKTNTNPFRALDSNAMDVDDTDDFLNGPDADDFGSDYESAADDIPNPPAYSVAQADAQEDIELALALSASLASPALSTRTGPTSTSNPWSREKSSNGVSTASVQAAQREREMTWSTPLTSVSGSLFDVDPPNYATIASSGGTRSNANNRKSMCVVCETKPAFNNGYRSFPTCGNTCARLLDEAQKGVPKTRLPPNSNHGHLGNPKRNAGSSSSRGTAAGSHSSRSTSSPIKMCRVCGLRPIYQKGGKVFPTCGLTCAAKLHAPGSIPMCDYCHERPKVVINDKIFPHCGRTCRDKAKPAGGAHYYTTRATPGASHNYSPSPSSSSAARKAVVGDSSTCTTCVLCWAAPKKGPKNDFCSDLCTDIAVQRGPFLLEIPRGHASFQIVEQHCIENWKTKQSNYPIIKRIYMVQPHAGFEAAYRAYQAQISSPVGLNRNGNEVRHWISPSRQCSLGDAGYTTPCDSTKCMLCSLVRTSPKSSTCKGILTMSELERAVERATNMAKGRGNILLLSQVLIGKAYERSKNELDSPLPQGYNSVRLVEYTLYGLGSNIHHGDNVVFDCRAVKPLYLITFE